MSRSTILQRAGALALALVLPTACAPGLFDMQHGKMDVAIQWPHPASKGYAVQAIPDGTVRIDVAILGEGIPDGQPLTASFTPKADDASTEIDQVPIGPKFLTATAYDAANHATASGQTTIAVQPNVLVPAVIVLNGLATPNPDKSPSPEPSASGTLQPIATPTPPTVPDFTINTVAGNGQLGAVDAKDGLQAEFRYPHSAVYNPTDHAVYVADVENHLIRRYDPLTHAVTTFAGVVPPSANPSAAPTAPPLLAGSYFGTPGGIAVDPHGTVFFTDMTLHVIRKVLSDGSTVTVAGSGHAGDVNASDPLAASFNLPVAIAFDHAGNLFVADYGNQKIKRIDLQGHVVTIAGTGQAGSSGDGGPALSAMIDSPSAIAVDPGDSLLYVAESHNPRVRRIQLGTGLISTVAGTGQFGTDNEGALATTAGLTLPEALGFTAGGDLLIAEGWGLTVGTRYTTGSTSRVLRLTQDGRLVRIAGQLNRSPGYGGDGDDARQAILDNPAGLATDGSGNIYIVDAYNNRLRLLHPAPAVPAATPLPVAAAHP